MYLLRNRRGVRNTLPTKGKESMRRDTRTQGKGEDYDAISINADTYDSDIEGASCEERIHEIPVTAGIKATGQPDDLVMDIEKSVNEILGMAEPVLEEVPTVSPAVLPEDIQPSAQQLELLELEMRARAIKALMKADSALLIANIFRSALQIIEGTCTDNRHYSITEIQFKTDTRSNEGPARKLTNYEEKGRHERWMEEHFRNKHTKALVLFCLSLSVNQDEEGRE
ncbi:unnamed protein product [Ranitomeya imitator]|uniref:Uncharacterized protein n=1 Tax=Ranitomeya imitator TaxID=111125 RepID=A0ABN9LMU4_9NEOB|nr:unnamed protein product [Ranitomeya imitator]